MTSPEAIKIGLVNAIAATGMLAKAKAPPPNIPAHKHVMINRSLADASAKRSNGIAAQRLPSSNAFPMARLTALFDAPSVSFDAARNEVRVRSEWESRSVVQVIDLVESWLASDGPEWVTLSVGDRTYTMHGSNGSATPGPPSAA